MRLLSFISRVDSSMPDELGINQTVVSGVEPFSLDNNVPGSVWAWCLFCLINLSDGKLFTLTAKSSDETVTWRDSWREKLCEFSHAQIMHDVMVVCQAVRHFHTCARQSGQLHEKFLLLRQLGQSCKIHAKQQHTGDTSQGPDCVTDVCPALKVTSGALWLAQLCKEWRHCLAHLSRGQLHHVTSRRQFKCFVLTFRQGKHLMQQSRESLDVRTGAKLLSWKWWLDNQTGATLNCKPGT